MERIALFTGTFDPFTIGHQNIVERALPLFDKIVISVAMSKLKHAQEEMLESMKKAVNKAEHQKNEALKKLKKMEERERV